MPGESEYSPVGNAFSGPTENSRCMVCRFCLTVDPDTVYCSVDVYLEGEPFPRERVFEGSGMLVARCFMFKALDFLGEKQRAQMRQVECTSQGGTNVQKIHRPL